nr:hypothetical protein [uncultured Brevundimonas sp.]
MAALIVLVVVGAVDLDVVAGLPTSCPHNTALICAWLNLRLLAVSRRPSG